MEAVSPVDVAARSRRRLVRSFKVCSCPAAEVHYCCSEYVMHYFAIGLQYIYDVSILVPRWMLMLATGGVASLIMRLMHRNPEAEAPKPEPVEEKPPVPPTPKAASGTSISTPTKSKAKSRKGGKK